ncbi:unnamed protein product [Oppiella nova]|uniref:Protein kinase domain-containing protein n=1 Tax=Oppiella nova TaxID=334625 RepID=A0A7R9LW83_9ACAR|nr:unnamed protein product [Oppiella nova]CAG2167470.1 unnamed protein product [Oppiella nova]
MNLADNFSDKEILRVFKETKHMSKVQSKYCVEYYDSWLERDCYYIQMELYADSLKNFLEHKPQELDRDKWHPMNSYEYFISCEIFREILECVQYLHEMQPPIIHRDLSPANILISESAKSGRFIKLGDFGLATIHDPQRINDTKSKYTGGVGTYGFMAPEVFDCKPYSHKCDIYSLAIIGTKLFEFDLVTFDKDNPQPYSSHNANLNDPEINLEGLNAKEKERALNEAQSLLKVRSPYVVEYYHSWETKDQVCIQMELCSHNLRDVIDDKPHLFDRNDEQALNEFEYFVSCKIFEQILESVQYIHKLDPIIIHRDLKPENILVISGQAGNGKFLKLCDFGLAKFHDRHVHYMTANKHTADVGDIRYMAPEVIQGKKYGHKCDIYTTLKN